MQEKKENQNQNQINIELPDDVADGIYSNLAIITHSPIGIHRGFYQDDAGCAQGQSQVEDHPYSAACQKALQGVKG